MGKNRDAEISRFQQQGLEVSRNRFTVELLGKYLVCGKTKEDFPLDCFTLVEHAAKTKVKLTYDKFYRWMDNTGCLAEWKEDTDMIGIYVDTSWDVFQWKSKHISFNRIKGMSLFQCGKCGCVENTACSAQGFIPDLVSSDFNWTGKEDLLKQFKEEGRLLCCMCGPTHHRDGKPTEFNGKWHNNFPLTYLPKGKFKTNSVGTLEHIETGEKTYMKYAL